MPSKDQTSHAAEIRGYLAFRPAILDGTQVAGVFLRAFRVLGLIVLPLRLAALAWRAVSVPCVTVGARKQIARLTWEELHA
eukprot:3650400-Rhodomonas_salina.1